MRTLRQLGQDLIGFIEGHDHGICILVAERDHLSWVYAALQDIDVTSPHVFLSFPQAFASADDYARIVADGCLTVARERAGDAGLAPPGPTDAPAAARVRAALELTRDTILPRRTSSPRLVPVLVPLTSRSEDDSLHFTRAVAAANDGWPPWFHRMRIFVHAPPGAALGPLPRFVRVLTVDLSMAALTAGVTADANDPDVSPEQRTQALLQVASLDAANGRYDAAIAGFREVYARTAVAPNPVFAALALSGIGDVASLRKDMLEAVAWYERALVPASETGAALLLLLVTRSLARLYFELGRHTDAETFYDGAQRLAMAVPDAMSHVEALQWRGRLQELRGAHKAAGASYLAAAQVARDHGHGALLDELRPRLAATRHRVADPLAREISTFLEEPR